MIGGCADPDRADDRPDPRAPQGQEEHGNGG
jgi:hypothetical protein